MMHATHHAAAPAAAAAAAAPAPTPHPPPLHARRCIPAHATRTARSGSFHQSIVAPAAAAAVAAARRSLATAAAAAAMTTPRRLSVSCRATAAAAVPTAEPGKTTLAFLGLGIMGVPMALNLIKAGYKVVLWNRSSGRDAALVAAGATVAASPADAARAADITFAMLSDPPAALAVATGPSGVCEGLSPGKGYVDVSTVDAATSAAVAAAVKATGALFLEAPVSGSKGPAEQGALIFLAAGDEALYEAAAGPLDVMGKAKFFLGAVGRGAHMKLVVNAVMGAQMAAWGEGLALAGELGLQQQDVIDVVALGAIACPMYALKGPTMARRTYPAAFPLKHQQKDLRLALGEADAQGLALPVIAAANEQYVRARRRHGDDDFSAVLEAVLGGGDGK